jgi:Methyltransferase domain
VTPNWAPGSFALPAGTVTFLLTDIEGSTSLWENNPEAMAAAVDERYVREWLGAMVTGHVVDYDPTMRTYRLPKEHAASLTRAAGVGNLACVAQTMAMLGGVESEIVHCFHEGGGVPYSSFPTFHTIMAESSKAVVDAALLEGALPLVPGLVGRLEAGMDVADLGCGSGYAACVMARAFPNSRFSGFDFSQEAIATARHQASAW